MVTRRQQLDLIAKSLGPLAFGLNLPDQGQGDSAVGSYSNVAADFWFPPEHDTEDIFRSDKIVGRKSGSRPYRRRRWSLRRKRLGPRGSNETRDDADGPQDRKDSALK